MEPLLSFQRAIHEYWTSFHRAFGMRLCEHNLEPPQRGLLAKSSAERQLTPNNVKLWSTRGGLFKIHRSSSESGLAVYCGNVIASLPDVPLVLTINRGYADIERAMAKQSHGHWTLLDIFCHTFAARGIKEDREAERLIVRASQAVWTKRHPLIEAVAYKCHVFSDSSWPPEIATEVFGDRYYAASRSYGLCHEVLIARQEREWEEEGRLRLPEYFNRFGVISAERQLRLQYQQAKDESFAPRGHRPTEGQLELLRVLQLGLQLLAQELAAVMQRAGVSYRILGSGILGGCFKERRQKRLPVVYLSHKLFSCDLARALAIFVHEHAHAVGSDGSREFTDAVTAMLEKSIRCRDQLAPLEAEWDRLRSPTQCA